MKVLIADDEPVSRRLLESLLKRWGYDVSVATDGDEASKILLSADAPKLVVLDWLMPGFNGIDLCHAIRRGKPEPYTYIILVTAKKLQGDMIEGLDAGADDYVTKPFEPLELKVRLRTGKRILFLQDQLISSRDALRDQATHDQLTGLWNRAAITTILEDELARALREGSSVGLLLGDLDHFKLINDTHGHRVGDDVLRQVSLAMRGAIRRYDSLGRYGGEEFLIVLPGCDQATATSHAERLRGTLRQLAIPSPAGQVHPSISLGVAVADARTLTAGGDVVHASDLIHAADMALYRAKRAGRDCVEFADPSELSAAAALADR